MMILLTVQVESESSSLDVDENRSFGVLTVTSSTSIDSYFAKKLARLQSKAKKNKSTTKTASSSTDEHQDQTKPDLTTPVSSETSPDVSCDMVTIKQRKKKRKRVNVDDDCCISDERLHSKSVNSNRTSKKKKKRRRVDDLSEVTVECNGDSLDVKTCRKKRMPRITVASELNQSEHTTVKKRKS